MDPLSSSPICHCEALQATVRTDQTQQECAHEHRCSVEGSCPLADSFVRISEPFRASRTWE